MAAKSWTRRYTSWLPWISSISSTIAYTAVPPPSLKLSDLGQVTVGGNFDAISLYSYIGQLEGSSNNSTQYDSVFTQGPDGTYIPIATTDGRITDMCPFITRNGTYAGLAVAGDFTSVNGVSAQSIAFLQGSNYQVVPAPGIQGRISSLLCDNNTDTIYVGGSFEASLSSNAIAWLASGSWSNLAFHGFDAPVNSITRAPNNNIIFGGSFSGLKNTTYTTTTSTGVPTDAQVINLQTASYTSTANVSSADGLACYTQNSTSSQPWRLQDNTPGSLTATLGYGFEPSKLTLYNNNGTADGVRTFRYIALPDTGIMNFTYTDPLTGTLKACDATCPLAKIAGPQDFYFVNRVGMDSFTIDVSAWYGNAGALSGIELSQNDTFVYAIEAFNEPSCKAPAGSQSSQTGPWQRLPARQSAADYLSATLTGPDLFTANVQFQPNIQGDGNYTIVMYTPGCIQDGSCALRGIVNITTQVAAGQSNTVQLYQTNNYEKYDTIYQGQITAAKGNYRPTVTISSAGLMAEQVVVASRVEFNGNPSTGGLNGLFEFNASQIYTADTNDFAKSAINNAGTMLHANADIVTLQTTPGSNGTLYSAGSFSDDTLDNIMSFHDNAAHPLPYSGLNGAVNAMFASTDALYVGGNFTGTNSASYATGANGSMTAGPTGLSRACKYNYSANAWQALGAGLDGTVVDITRFYLNLTGTSYEVLGFSGDFQNILAANGNPQHAVSNGFAIWVEAKNGWLQDVGTNSQLLSGKLSASTVLGNSSNPANRTWIGAGTLSSLGNAYAGAVGLNGPNNNVEIQQLPVQINSVASNTSTMQKRAIFPGGQTGSGVLAGTYYESNNQNISILGGHFTSTVNGTALRNLIFIDGKKNSVTGLPSGLDDSSTITALALSNNLLFVGGQLSGNIAGSAVSALVIYDMNTQNFRPLQPAGLQGGSAFVNSIVPQSGSSHTYVGGNFQTTSDGLACSTVCMYDTSSNQWSAVGSGLTGTVANLYFAQNTLYAAGNLTLNNNAAPFVQYDTKKQTWSTYKNIAFPGPATAFSSTSGQEYWLAGMANNGSTYIVRTSNNNLISANAPTYFASNTAITNMVQVPLSQNHGKTDILDQDMALVVMGSLNLTNYGNVSSAIYNGTMFVPFLLSVNNDGSPGALNSFFTSKTNPGSGLAEHFHHSLGLAVLVAFCAALGVIFLVILFGMLINRLQRKRSGYSQVPNMPYQDKNTNINRVPPDRLFASVGGKNPGAPVV